MSDVTRLFTANTSVSGRTIYISDNLNITNDVLMEYKLKNSIPSITLFGMGAVVDGGLKYKSLFSKEGNWYSYYCTSSRDNAYDRLSISPTLNSVFKIETENLHTTKLYHNGTLLKTYSTNTNYPVKAMLQNFNASPLILEYLMIKPL